MKALITLLFIACSMVAFGQDIDTLKISPEQAQKFIDIQNELKEGSFLSERSDFVSEGEKEISMNKIL